MADHAGNATDDLLTRFKAALAGPDGEIDVESVRTSLREAVANAGSEIDVDAIVDRAKAVAGNADDKLDSEKLKQWLGEAESGKLGEWLAEAKIISARAVSTVGAHGEQIAENAPGAFDTLLGAAKETLGKLTGNEALAHQGELDQLKGQIKEKFAAKEE
jgi:uncharacterized protein YjbJ (UPF0337 family)